jgi:hypothetical protein
MFETLPAGYLRISEGVELLAQGMWGGLRRPDPVRDLKKRYRGAISVTFDPWKQKAGKRLTLAAVDEDIPVYVFWRPYTETTDPEFEIMRVPGSTLERLIRVRGKLPDHPRASMRVVEKNEKLYRALNTGILIIRKRDFDAWYRRERQKGRWPSQRGKLEKEGRPSRQTERLRKAVVAIMQDGKMTIAELRRRLIGSGRSDVPSADTLARLVDELYRETGEAKFRRLRRARPGYRRSSSRKTRSSS